MPIPIHVLEMHNDSLLRGYHPEECPMAKIKTEINMAKKFWPDLMAKFP